jgi:hypothetical protein
MAGQPEYGYINSSQMTQGNNPAVISGKFLFIPIFSVPPCLRGGCSGVCAEKTIQQQFPTFSRRHPTNRIRYI